MLEPNAPGRAASPLDGLDRIAAVCDRYEAHWRGGDDPRIESYLDDVSEIDRTSLLHELIALDLRLRDERGDPSSQVDYEARFPGDTEVIDAVFHVWRASSGEVVPNTVSQHTPGHEGTPLPGGMNEGPGKTTGPPSQAIGKYIVVEALDSGGQGQVFRVLHPTLRGEFALKIASRPVGLDPASREQFLSEGRLLARLNHPNLVRVVDLDFHEERPFLVLEYVPGRTLQRHIEESRPVPRESARLVAKLAEAVGYLHGQGIIHQDIKPRNVLLDEQGQPRLIDLGLAQLRHIWTETPSGSSGGTPACMAPEQASGERERIGDRTDVFGLGAVLYTLLTGRPLYQGKSYEEVMALARKAEIVPPRQVRPDIPRALERVCMKALAHEPERRYRFASELKQALNRYLERPRAIALGAASVFVLGLFVLVMVLARPASRPLEAPPAPTPAVVSPTPAAAPVRVLA